MKKFLLAGAAAVALTFAAGAAQAGLLTLTPGPGGLTFGLIPGPQPANGTNEALPLFSIASTGDGFGYYGATVSGTPGATYTYEILGAEAGFTNSFTIGAYAYDHPGGTLFVASLADNLSSTTSASLAFGFGINSGIPTVLNGSNPNNTISGATANFFASFNPNAADGGGTTGDVLYLFLDDGNSVDDNHDDFVVRITATATPVPEPASLALLGAGLIGLGFAARRRRA